MGIDEIALPFPYPEISTAEGLYVECQNSGLENANRLGLFEAEDKKDVYELRIELLNYPWNIDEICDLDWIFHYADGMLALFDLPLSDQWNSHTDDPAAAELKALVLKAENVVILRFEITREEFEDVYLRVATSDYVQLIESTQIVYIVSRLPGQDLTRVEEVYRRFYPAIHDREVLAAPDELELRVLINRQQEVLGYSEPDLNCFMGADFMKTDYAKHGLLVMGWGDWSGNTRGHGRYVKRRQGK